MSSIHDTHVELNPGELLSLGCVTGRPVGQGGIRGRESLTGVIWNYSMELFSRSPSQCSEETYERNR